MQNSDAVQNGDPFAGCKQEDARTTDLSTSATTVAAHNPDQVDSLSVYKPKKVSYPDAQLGMGTK